MSSHHLIVAEVQEANVVFRCTNCLQLIGFNKPGIGEPSAQLADGQWVPPDDCDAYLSPCETIEAPSEVQGSVDEASQSDQFQKPNDPNAQI